MRYTKRGTLPAKKHIQFRDEAGNLYAEQVFGTKGFSGIISTLYHINAPTQMEAFEAPKAIHIFPSRPPKPCAITTSKRKISPRMAICQRARSPAPQRRRDDERCASRCEYDRLLQERGRRRTAVYSSRRGRFGDHVRHTSLLVGRLSRRAERGDIPRDIELRRHQNSRYRSQLRHRNASQIPQRVRANPRTRALYRARYEGTRRTRDHQREGRLRCQYQGTRSHHAVSLPLSPARYCRLGRLPVSLGVQHLRFSADKRSDTPAAARPSDLRGA